MRKGGLTSMGLLNLLLKDPLAFALIAIPFLYSVVIHEVAHGWVAYRMGDPTAKWLGRLTLNPLKHLDLIGTLMLFVAGFGWAKPVPINLNNIPDKRKGLIFVSSAGILANILFASVALLFFRLFSIPSSGIAAILVYYVVQINITLAALNLIPIPPLDGSKILMGIAPGRTPYFLARLEPYGFFIIIGLLYLGILDPLIGILRWIIGTAIGTLLP
ncbi:MAG TPA: site-2 protease family protein [Thermodesulfobacteriota bacterium]|nr:site-2 protease family protein [Thermodesulfobacteriota bacterium]